MDWITDLPTSICYKKPHPVHKAHKSTAHSHPSLHSAPRPNRTAKTKMKSWYSPQKRSPLPRQYEDRRDRHRNHDNDQYNGRGNGSDDDLGNGDRDLDTARTRPSGQSRPMPAQSSSESTSQDDPSESVQLTESPAELLVIRQITSLVYDNDQLFSAVQEYNSTVVSALSESRDDASDDLAAVFKRLNVEHIRASEFLMKTLLKIDDLACESGFERARTKRRDAVKFIQGLMERVDLLHQRALKGFERWAASEPPF
ncbi:uncharacterized protein BJ171DRAFT_502021 [Polychytrium aggregatum]|uniref:uncharacterized protein n=1 Tax=Polychytrium aggregatum TaxID=110093 RepID=UPI0022FE1DEE|nr:uncharacterized protein BJ171DRAFT_502021 [Polychytrium aggregatum]KAI9205398.1 hypothetical protein BJ171DRAFT_502021 [Polychytrium aggregatum]